MDINIVSYNDKRTIDYYSTFDGHGLFSFERKIIEKYFVGKSVIDIGCGAGRTTYPLYTMGYDVIGVDYSEGMIDCARQKYPHIRFETGNCADLKYKDETFDNALFSFNGIMLERNYNMREKMFSEIHRILIPGGIFFFTTPYMDNKFNRSYWKEKAKKEHLDLSKKSDRILFGDDVTDEDGVAFFLHIPFCDEIEDMIRTTGFTCISKGARLSDFGEEKPEVEDELDDNYYWVVSK